LDKLDPLTLAQLFLANWWSQGHPTLLAQKAALQLVAELIVTPLEAFKTVNLFFRLMATQPLAGLAIVIIPSQHKLLQFVVVMEVKIMETTMIQVFMPIQVHMCKTPARAPQILMEPVLLTHPATQIRTQPVPLLAPAPTLLLTLTRILIHPALLTPLLRLTRILIHPALLTPLLTLTPILTPPVLLLSKIMIQVHMDLR